MSTFSVQRFATELQLTIQTAIELFLEYKSRSEGVQLHFLVASKTEVGRIAVEIVREDDASKYDDDINVISRRVYCMMMF